MAVMMGGLEMLFVSLYSDYTASIYVAFTLYEACMVSFFILPLVVIGNFKINKYGICNVHLYSLHHDHIVPAIMTRGGEKTRSIARWYVCIMPV